MENVVNLSERRKQKVSLPDNAAEIMEAFVLEYIHRAFDNMPMGKVMDYALMAIESEIRSMPFETAMAKIELEFPDLACQFNKDMSV